MISVVILHVSWLSLTPVICHVSVYCFGSFLMQDVFLSLQAFAFEGQNMMLNCLL